MVSPSPKGAAHGAERSLSNRWRWLGLGVTATVWLTSSVVAGLVAAGHPRLAGWVALGLGAIAGGLMTYLGQFGSQSGSQFGGLSGSQSGGDRPSSLPLGSGAAKGVTEPSLSLWVPVASFKGEMQREWRRSARNRQSLALVVCEAIAPHRPSAKNPATNPAINPDSIPDLIPEFKPPAGTEDRSTPSALEQGDERVDAEENAEELTIDSPPSSALVQEIAQALERAAKRSADLLVWLEGDRLAALLPNTDALGAIAVGEDLQRELAGVLAAANPAQELQVAIAAATALPETGGSAEDFLESAMGALAIAHHHRDGHVYLAGLDALGDRPAGSPSSPPEASTR